MREQYAERVQAFPGTFDTPALKRVPLSFGATLSVAILGAGLFWLETAIPAWSAILVVVALFLTDWLTLPGDTTRRAETPVFGFVVASAVLFNPVVAGGMALLSVCTGDLFRPATAIGPPIAVRLTLALGLVAAGAVTMQAPALAPALILVWIGFIAFWMHQQWRLGNAVAVRRHGLMLGWIVFMLAMPLYMPFLPSNIQDLVMPGVPALHFALGFMTADTAIVSWLGVRKVGRAGVWFWLRELTPTFTRYNIMAVTGSALAVFSIAAGMTGLSLGITALLFVFLVLRERELGHRRLVSTICLMASALEARDSYTKGHADRVSSFAVAVAEQLGWSGRDRRDLEIAAHLHDIGKVGIPDDILLKPGRFTDEDFAVMKRHSAIGAGIVTNSAEVRHVAPIVRQHHERLDGSGYPDGISGDAIHPAARILGAVDAFDAMTSNRPYRSAMDQQTALDIIVRGRGTEFEPAVVDVLVDLVENGNVEGVLAFGYCLTH